MSQTASATQEPEGDPKVLFVRSTDVQKTGEQIQQLLNIANHSAQVLCRPDSVESKLDVDDVALKEARKTYELVNLQLRQMVDEQLRWSLVPSALETRMSAAVTKHEEMVAARIEVAKNATRPSVFLQPQVRLFNVGWIAWLGDGMPESSSLHGVGRTPAEAMQAFDRAFFQAQSTADTVPVPPPAPPAPKRRKK